MILDMGDGKKDGDGAYNKATFASAPHEGTIYLVTGSSGKTSGGSLDHPVMFTSLAELGSLVIDIDGNQMDAKFLNDKGLVRDYFTIIKETNSVDTQPPVPPTNVRVQGSD